MYIHLVVNVIFGLVSSTGGLLNLTFPLPGGRCNSARRRPTLYVLYSNDSLSLIFRNLRFPHPRHFDVWLWRTLHLSRFRPRLPTAAASFAARASFTLTISSYITHHFSLPYHRWLGRSASFGFVVHVRQELILIPKGACTDMQCQKVSSYFAPRSKLATDHPLLRTYVHTWINTARKSSEDRESSISLPKFPRLSGQHAARGKDWITWIRRGVEMR